jgi:hypothetical protein
MRFFGGKSDDKEESKSEPRKEPPPSESQRLTPKTEPKKLDVKKGSPLKTFILGLVPHEKLGGVGDERFEEGLRATLPKGTRVSRVTSDVIAPVDGARLFEVEGSLELNETILLLQEKGLLEGQVDLALDRCLLVFRATGRIAALSGAAELVDRFGFRYDMRCESHEVFVQYPPADVHKRWLADDDYRAAYQRWRTQRSEDPKAAKWHSGWPASTGDETGPPWVRLRAKEGKSDEYALEFDEKILLRFSFQGAEIKIMRFNLKVLSNKLTNEFSTYRSLPLSLESIPKEVQDRLNREPDRYRALKEPGKFGTSFDLVRRAYEELGGEYFTVERILPVPGTSSSQPRPAPVSSASSPAPAPPAPAPSVPVEGSHWSDQPAVSNASDYVPSDSQESEDAVAKIAAAPPPKKDLAPTTPKESQPASARAPTNPAMPRPQSTLRGGLRKSDVGVALPLAPKPKPEHGEH